MPTIFAAVHPVLKAAGFKKKGNQFVKVHTQDIDVMLSFAAHPSSDREVLFLCPQLYVYSDEFARLGRQFCEPTREWYASAYDVAIRNMTDFRAEHAFDIRREIEAEAAANELKQRLTHLVLPLIVRTRNADDICTLFEEHDYRLHCAAPKSCGSGSVVIVLACREWDVNLLTSMSDDRPLGLRTVAEGEFQAVPLRDVHR